MCWLKLLQINPLLTVKILYALEGAISGVHEAALPAARRQELVEWASLIKPEPGN
jgi:DNA transformation protein